MFFPCGRLPHTFTADHTPRRAHTQWPLGVLIAAVAMQLGIHQSFPLGKTRADGRSRRHFVRSDHQLGRSAPPFFGPRHT